jgi:hypothetical protein
MTHSNVVPAFTPLYTTDLHFRYPKGFGLCCSCNPNFLLVFHNADISKGELAIMSGICFLIAFT